MSLASQDVHLWPIVAALEPDGLWHNGIGQVVIARRMPSGRIAFAIFLVDIFCLGVKNVLWAERSKAEFDTMLDNLERVDPLHAVSPEYLSKLVHCAVDYAQALGIPPHPDFRQARLLLEGIDPSLCGTEFEFGSDRKSFAS